MSTGGFELILLKRSLRRSAPEDDELRTFLQKYAVRLQFFLIRAYSPPTLLSTRELMKLSKETLKLFTPDKVRNFSVIAHIDHGKSTLSDRLLETTGTLSTRTKNDLFMDKLQVEKEIGRAHV